MEKEFKVRPNYAVGVFNAAVVIMLIFNLSSFINGQLTLASFMFYVVFTAVLTFYFVGCRPVKYTVKDKEVIMHRRLIPDKKVDLIHAEVIADPVSKMSDIVTRPHGIELYMDDKACIKFFPMDAAAFTGAILGENKRIHCTVKAYTDMHRKIEKRERKQRRKEERRRRSHIEE
ncbi:hypothetical protein [Sharpea azabuensis]|uniref:hypothetical protein n=1 Tax=Sharpea azabuensis TaxID=322505 RepID=UPI0013DB3106|nr:hypothetical protein [Sharpea azabuensis]